jgi:hypothetical protein
MGVTIPRHLAENQACCHYTNGPCATLTGNDPASPGLTTRCLSFQLQSHGVEYRARTGPCGSTTRRADL